MSWFFSKKQSNEDAEISNENQVGMAAEQHEESSENYPTVPVRDIKNYLVNEFENAKKQDQTIRDLEDKIDDLMVIKTKYDATLVLVDEYSARLGSKHQDIERYKKKLEAKNIELSDIQEENNDLKINRYEKEQYRREVEKVTRINMNNDLILMIDSHKGVLPKELVKQWINDLSEGACE